jgi:hypothetical protein
VQRKAAVFLGRDHAAVAPRCGDVDRVGRAVADGAKVPPRMCSVGSFFGPSF